MNLGKNAIALACECINKFKPRSQKGLNYNFGLVKGGTAVNIVPDFVETNLVVRGDSEEKLNHFVEKIEKHFKEIILKKKGRLSVKKERIGSAYTHKKQDKFIKELIGKFRQLNIKTKPEKSLGLSDANILNYFGIKAIEIGYGPRNVHTNNESIAINQMEKMTDFLTRLLADLSNKTFI